MFIFDVLKKLIWIITEPFYNGIRLFFPSLQQYSDNFSTFLSTYVFRGLAFCREIFLNFTGIPRSLYEVMLFYIFGVFALWFSVTGLIFILNALKAWKRGI